MASSTSRVVVDGVVSDEKLSELLRLQSEYPELDYKATLDLSVTRDTVELAKDVGAMQVRGGYLLIGVNDDGSLSGGLDEIDHRPFDEANLTSKLLRYLPERLVLASRVTIREGHSVAIICVSPSTSGCAFFTAPGAYADGKGEKKVFKAGEVFWRDGTKSVRLGQSGLEALMAVRPYRAARRLISIDALLSGASYPASGSSGGGGSSCEATLRFSHHHLRPPASTTVPRTEWAWAMQRSLRRLIGENRHPLGIAPVPITGQRNRKPRRSGASHKRRKGFEPLTFCTGNPRASVVRQSGAHTR
jgi:hypothetical protein